MKDTKVFILAGGFGTRLGDLTKDKPKPMMDINGKPFLEYIINSCRQDEFKDIILCTGYKSEIIEQYFSDGEKFGVNITYSREFEPLGTAGCIKNASQYMEKNNLILNGDTYIDIKLSSVLRFHQGHNGIATILCTKNNNENRSGGITLRGDRVLSFEEKTEKRYISAGVIVFSDELTNILNQKNSKNISLEKEILPELLHTHKMYAYVTDKQFIDIGIPSSLEYFKQYIKGEAK